MKSGNTYLDENVAAALIGASYYFHKETGRKIFLNQLGSLSGGHSGHGGMGDRVDFQYLRRNNTEGPTWTTHQSYDVTHNKKFVDEYLRKFGFKRFYTQDAPESKTPKIPGTVAVDPHHHHLHADFDGGTKMVIRKITARELFTQEVTIKTWGLNSKKNLKHTIDDIKKLPGKTKELYEKVKGKL